MPRAEARGSLLFRNEFHRWAEEVMKESPLSGIELVEEWDYNGIIEAFISEPLPYMGLVFLFHMDIIIFVIGSAPGELYRLFSSHEVSDEVVVQELRAVVTVES